MRECPKEVQLSQELNAMLEAIHMDLLEVMRQGANKHGIGSWLDPNNPSLQHKANHASLFRHLSESYCGKKEDDDSGVDPKVHIAIRCLMAYYRENE